MQESGEGATASPGAEAGAESGASVALPLAEVLVMAELLLTRPAVILIVLRPRRFAPPKE